MAYEIRWSPEALEDLENIADYIARDSKYYTAVIVEKMLAAVESLGEMPFRGRMVPEVGSTDVRELLVHAYRLIYKIDDDTILVLAVIHAQRLLERNGRF